VSRARLVRSAAVVVALALLVPCAPRRTRAHGLDPASLSLRETEPGVYEVIWRASALRLPGANVQPALPPRCRRVGTAEAIDGGNRVALRWTVDCGPTDIAGETIGIDDLASAKINGLVSIERRHAPPVQAVLSPRSPTFIVPARPRWSDVVRAYVALGVEHILTGPDHLLFVFGLLLLVSTSRLLLQTITAFTVGHSITLSLAALGLATVPQRPVEVLIAVSVLVLAVELARDPARTTLLRRFPWAMAILFGLLHGFGFAGALREAGLPAGEVPLALVSFNGGIELGQLAFVAGVLILGAVLGRWLPALTTRTSRPAVYAMGILAAFWFYERLALWLA
jgi:hydrogenase/urease accessory protein HupE